MSEPILLVMSDLLFRSKLDAAARSAGRELRVARSVEQLERHLGAGAPFAFAVVDLECDTVDSAAAIRRLRATAGGADLSILAYAGHTNVEALLRGRDAGANRVIARSAVEGEFGRLLSQSAE
ncbi:MAG TPA: hypothetical protein VEI06_13185 [Gemmatimonadaceae bacterium]|nr:hypothetical protein [Gemmatimonadaceae bacterium]